jgi:hypothetical protein
MFKDLEKRVLVEKEFSSDLLSKANKLLDGVNNLMNECHFNFQDDFSSIL